MMGIKPGQGEKNQLAPGDECSSVDALKMAIV